MVSGSISSAAYRTLQSDHFRRNGNAFTARQMKDETIREEESLLAPVVSPRAQIGAS